MSGPTVPCWWRRSASRLPTSSNDSAYDWDGDSDRPDDDRSNTFPVVIVGGGPAGLLLSHLLHGSGVQHVVVESRSRTEIATTQRAGILEAGSVDLLVGAGLDRVMRDGDRHDGIVLRFGGEDHPVDFAALTGRAVWLYPQTEVFADLAARRTADGGDIRWETTVTEVSRGARIGRACGWWIRPGSRRSYAATC